MTLRARSTSSRTPRRSSARWSCTRSTRLPQTPLLHRLGSHARPPHLARRRPAILPAAPRFVRNLPALPGPAEGRWLDSRGEARRPSRRGDRRRQGRGEAPLAQWLRCHREVRRRVPRPPELGRAIVLDGEVAAPDGFGITHLDTLAEVIRNRRTEQLAYIAFDLLHIDGHDLRGCALEHRKEVLRDVL